MNKQLKSLLDDSLSHFRKRHLKKALNTAQIALEFGLNENADSQQLAKANLLLARIYNTNGRYQNDPSFFQKAIFQAEEAQKINKNVSNLSIKTDVQLVLGEIYLNLKNCEKARYHLDRALEQAGKNNDFSREVLALSLKSQGMLEKNEPAKAIELAEQALNILQKNVKNNHFQLWSEVYLQLSQAYIKCREYSRSLEMSQLLLESSRKAGDAEKEVMALRNFAVVCGVKSNYKIGMQYFLEALDKCEAIGYRELMAQIQINIGTLYAHLYNYNEAIRRYQLVLDGHSDILDHMTQIIVFNNLGNIHYSTDQPEVALGYFEQAHSMAVKRNFEEMIAYTLAQLSRAKIRQENYEAAEAYTLEAQQFFNRLDIVNGKQIHMLNMGKLAFQNGQFEVAEQDTRAAIDLARELRDDTSEIRGYKLLANIFKAKKNFEQALVYQERYAEIQEEFAKLQRTRQFLDLEIRHAIREQQKEIEQLTRNNEYQALLLQKSDQISRQNEELLRVNDDLRQFAYVVSHDLKEPLRMIGAYTQVIQKLTQPMLEEKDLEYFSYVTEGVDRINSLLDGLLKYTTIGNVKMELEKVNLNNVIPVCLANLRVSIEEKGAEIIVSELPKVKANAQLLTQLFQNLISNALKFVKPDVQPVVRISALKTEQSHIIRVSDNGIGISEEDQAKIFKIFHRLHHRSEYEGTGIGLAICQKIAARLGGSISVESVKGEGASFSLTLPLNA